MPASSFLSFGVFGVTHHSHELLEKAKIKEDVDGNIASKYRRAHPLIARAEAAYVRRCRNYSLKLKTKTKNELKTLVVLKYCSK
jgi:hypothetical protein